MTDLISRQAVLDIVDDLRDCMTVVGYWSVVERTKALPDLQPTCNQLATDCISRQALCEYALNQKDKCVTPNDIMRFPSAQPEWNNHTVACMLAELFDDTCACNYNGIDEWLPEKCEVIDACPNPVGVACWEQFLKHRAERRTDEADYRKE